MDILQVNELKRSLERRDARILELERQLEATRQERGEAVAWAHVATMNGVDFVQYPVYLTEQAAKWSIGNYAEGSKVRIEPLSFLHPTPDAGRVAELEKKLGEQRRISVELNDQCVDYCRRIAALEAQLAETEAQAKHFDWHISYIGKELTDSLEREWRMREALTVYGVHSINCINDDNRCVCGFDAVLDYALAADKEGE